MDMDIYYRYQRSRLEGKVYIVARKNHCGQLSLHAVGGQGFHGPPTAWAMSVSEVS